MARNKYRIARKSIWYVLRTLIIAAAIVGLCFAVFVEGMQVSNLYILVTEGLDARADVIINDLEPDELTLYFTDEFIANDNALYTGEYTGFTVASYDYRVDIRSFFVLPWSVKASMTIDDNLAAINAAADSVGEDETPPELPEWTSGRYEMVFTKVGSRWYISGMGLVKIDPEPDVRGTPDMSLLEDAGGGE